MAYSTITKPKDHFDGKTYLGSSSAVTVTGLEFQPDLVWVKDRDNGNNHCLVDAVRGVGKYIQSDNNLAETNNSSQSISAFTSDGFTTGTGNPANESASTTKGFMSWNWKANGAGSANTDGSINSTVSVNATSGFSIVKWTGTGANATIGHGLGAVPKMIICKSMNQDEWGTYHASTGNNTYFYINSNQEALGATAVWNDTTPTSSVFSVGTSGATNKSGAMIAYCFAEKTGYSKFGLYAGNNNNDGTFIYTGMKPSFVLLKKTNAAANWQLFDNKRVGYNQDNHVLRTNLSNVECTSCVEIDILSNGFKLRNTDGDGNNGNYIYMSIGQSLVGSNNVPCTAR